jgi:hypothetical protein
VSAGAAFLYVAGAASLAAIPIALYYARRQGQKQKLLAYAPRIARWPLVSARSLAAYQLAVVYTKAGGQDERIDAAFVHFLRFANFGREPIRREDIAPHNRLRIQVEGTRVLDFAIEAVRRSVCAIALEQNIPSGEFEEANVDFDFLDYHDGALVRILTISPPKRVELVGDIVGMPAGIVRADEVRKRPFLGWVGGTLSVLGVLGVLALTAAIFRWVTGSWSNVWLLALPLVGLVLLLTLIIAISETIWPKSGLQFPKELVMRLRGYPPAMFLDGPGAHVLIERYELDEAPDQANDDPGQRERT